MKSSHSSSYDVIIIGGGPVGLALGIELGLQEVKTLIIEKYQTPPLTPRAQSLSARTMEFFLRWQIDQQLEDAMLLPKSYPARGIWCSSLTGRTYFCGYWGDNDLAPNVSPKSGVRIPLWLTEKVLRQRLSQFSCVDFYTNHEASNILPAENDIIVSCLDRKNLQIKNFTAQYLACCDGANGIAKKKLNIPSENLTDKTQILSISFLAKDLQSIKSIPDGMFYSVISQKINAFIWPIDLKTGFWVAQIIWEDHLEVPTESNLSILLDQIAGKPYNKEITDFHFWDMQVQLANTFSLENRIFLLGDCAHAFAPAGGLGLNTGIGDALNLGWKLGAVLRNEAPSTLFTTYELERRPVCIRNLNFAKQNADDLVAIKKQYPPSIDFEGFAQASAQLGDRFLKSSGLTLGYSYTAQTTDTAKYQPNASPGFFLPHKTITKNVSIYHHLSACHWNLLFSDLKPKESDLISLAEQLGIRELHTVQITKNLYPHRFLLVRPDWHIAGVGNAWDEILKSARYSADQPGNDVRKVGRPAKGERQNKTERTEK